MNDKSQAKAEAKAKGKEIDVEKIKSQARAEAKAEFEAEAKAKAEKEAETKKSQDLIDAEKSVIDAQSKDQAKIDRRNQLKPYSKAAMKAKLDSFPKMTVRIPRSAGNKEPVPVHINGYRYEVQRGIAVEVPSPVAKLLMDGGFLDKAEYEMHLPSMRENMGLKSFGLPEEKK